MIETTFSKRRYITSIAAFFSVFVIVISIIYISYYHGFKELRTSQLKVYSFRLYSRAYLQAIAANYDTLKLLTDYRVTKNFENAEDSFVRLKSGLGIFQALFKESWKAGVRESRIESARAEEIIANYTKVVAEFDECLNGYESTGQMDFEKLESVERQIKDLTRILSFSEANYWKNRAQDFDDLLSRHRLIRTIFFTLSTLLVVLISILGLFGYKRIQLEEKIESNRMKFIAQSRMASLGEFSASVAHEINNPLTVILWRIKMLRKSLLEIEQDQELAKIIESIEVQARRIDQIIKGIRTLSKNTDDLDSEYFDLKQTLNQLHDIIVNKSLTNDFEFQINHGPEDVIIFGKPVQLIQVVTNLINNSIDAIANREERWIKISWEQDKKNVKILVTDSGEGIPKEQQDRLFELFYSTKQKHGTGIGLTISSQILNSHGGKLIYNHHSPNTQFMIVLPKAEMNHKKVNYV
ncbi:GHKL domain protein [Bacteriovorax sp. BSW11_IV]|uniref:sensor histidine kinase n=1 Tax=Bacteriovorax sp. BSW11_IV TaxID=1353529 RepID=UPI000389FECB|nr:HAMP domain-containing sensor histidine kinase [Bacteriovorax sp. BSW11_IV]EQC50325.1 GHKL domain protein [Bacteriovorax sp. BSW11_IV]